MSSTLKSYNDYKQFALDQVNIRKEPHFTSNAPTSRPTPMDLDAVAWTPGGDDGEKDLADGSDGKDGVPGQSGVYGFHGKGAGGHFNGDCRYCGKFGHRLNQCPVKDSDMQKGKAAKGSGGKGYGNNKGSYGKGSWKGYSGKSYYSGKGSYDGGRGKDGKGKASFQGKGMYWFDEPIASVEASQNQMWNGWDGWGLQLLQSADRPAKDIMIGSVDASVTTPILPHQAHLAVHNRFQALEDHEQHDVEDEVPPPPLPNQNEWRTKAAKRKKANRLLGALFEGAVKMPCCPVQAGTTTQKVDCPKSQAYKTEEHGWVKIRAIPDSGAIESVAPHDMALAYTVYPSAGSKRGQHNVTASGDEIPNEGEQFLPSVSENGVVTKQRWQMAAVTRPLQSVGELCDSGNRVIFGRGGGIIENIYTRETSPFIRENGTYIMEMWIPPVESQRAVVDSSFQWQGRS